MDKCHPHWYTFPICPSQLTRFRTSISMGYGSDLDSQVGCRGPIHIPSIFSSTSVTPLWNWEEESHQVHLQLMHMAPILELLLTHVERWCHFELLADLWGPIYFFLWSTRHVKAAPLLRSLSLSRCNAYFVSRGAAFQPDQWKDSIPLFGGLALDALRNVSLVGVHIDWDTSS